MSSQFGFLQKADSLKTSIMSWSCLMAKSALHTRCFGHRFSSCPYLKWSLIIVYDLWFTSLNWVKISLSISFLIQTRYSGSCKSPLTWGQGMQSLFTYAIAWLLDYYGRRIIRRILCFRTPWGPGTPWGSWELGAPQSGDRACPTIPAMPRWGAARGADTSLVMWAGGKSPQGGWVGLTTLTVPSGP